jgi:hypothetical protein
MEYYNESSLKNFSMPDIQHVTPGNGTKIVGTRITRVMYDKKWNITVGKFFHKMRSLNQKNGT